MSIIAIHGFNVNITLSDVMRTFMKIIDGPFEALNFNQPKVKTKSGKKKQSKTKTCYLRLSEKLDPVRVVEKINDFNAGNYKTFKASIPDKIPDIPLGSKSNQLPANLAMALTLPDNAPLEMTLNLSTEEIMTELQSKYPGLYSLSKKTGKKLLPDLYKKIFNRVKEIGDNSADNDSPYNLTRAYRRSHPHFGDFQLVLSTLHAIQDAAGTPRSQLEEADLMSTPPPPQTLDLPAEKVKILCIRYTEKIVKKMTEHIKDLSSDVSQTDTEDEIARKQVRAELKKMSPFLYEIVNQVINKHFMPKEGPMYRMRIYGEPFLPNSGTMQPFLARYHPVHVQRSTRMFNLLKFSVLPVHYYPLIAMNGTVLNGAKLLISSSDIAIYKNKEDGEGDEIEEELDDDEQMNEELEEDANEMEL